MSYQLFGAKSSTELMSAYYQLDPQEAYLNEILLKILFFSLKKMSLKSCLENARQLIAASMPQHNDT